VLLLLLLLTSAASTTCHQTVALTSDTMQAAGHGASVWGQSHQRQQCLVSSAVCLPAPVGPLPEAR
jgi:hypothetical protein